ncbi:MAG: ureidoglycolate hydrolase [Alphaproteobacteria bacterium]|nr:ureidoglycolate hydrolase [Alphaproteobacteria bacterium]
MQATPLPLRPFAAHELPLVRATPETLEGYGRLIPDYATCPIEIVRWPARGWRPVDSDTGDEGGTTEGIFEFWWRGDMLYGRNGAVGDTYLFGWNRDPAEAREDRADASRTQVLLWHANYHPDGGQVFFPREKVPFVVPLALPGDDVTPDKFTAFWFDGSAGLYIHPNVWHEAVFPLAERTSFHDKQGRVHARISVDFAREFGVYLSVPLRRP